MLMTITHRIRIIHHHCIPPLQYLKSPRSGITAITGRYCFFIFSPHSEIKIIQRIQISLRHKLFAHPQQYVHDPQFGNHWTMLTVYDHRSGTFAFSGQNQLSDVVTQLPTKASSKNYLPTVLSN